MNYQWLAGFFDGEGCIRIGNRSKHSGYSLFVEVSQTNDVSILKEIREFLGYGSLSHRVDSLQVLSFYCQNARSLLKSLLPYLKVKKIQARIGLHFQGYKEGGSGKGRLTEKEQRWRKEHYEMLIQCKHKDNSVLSLEEKGRALTLIGVIG